MSEPLYGFIYVRSNKWWDTHNTIKLGITTNLYNREATYITTEIMYGKYDLIIKIQYDKLRLIEKMMHAYFENKHIYYSGSGTEFYHKSIIPSIIPFIEDMGLQYEIITTYKYNYIRILKKINKHDLLKTLKRLSRHIIIIEPKEYQIEVINKIASFYESHNIGKIIWSCGLGKTLMALFIIRYMKWNRCIKKLPNYF